MNACCLGIFLVAGTALGQPPAGGDDFYLATTTAARELSTQLMFLQQAFATIPGPPEGRGFFGQSDRVLYDLSYFQQQLKQKVSREQLTILFDKMDGKLTQLMSDLAALEQWSPALRMVARRVQASEQDLHFALFSANAGPAAQQSQVAYRQTLAMLARTRDLANLVGYVFADPAVQKRWSTDFVELRRALVELQRLMQNNAERGAITKQLIQAD